MAPYHIVVVRHPSSLDSPRGNRSVLKGWKRMCLLRFFYYYPTTMTTEEEKRIATGNFQVEYSALLGRLSPTYWKLTITGISTSLKRHLVLTIGEAELLGSGSWLCPIIDVPIT